MSSGDSEHTQKNIGRESGPQQVVGSWSLDEARQPTSYPTGKRKEGEILTVEETAEYLRVRASTVYSWVENSLIPHIKMGRWFVSGRAILKAREPPAMVAGESGGG